MLRLEKSYILEGTQVEVNYCMVLCFFKFSIKRTIIICMLPLREKDTRKTKNIVGVNIVKNTHFNIVDSYIHPYLCSFSQYKIRETNNQLILQ